MRQQAKPFTVEVKKSRKSSHEPAPLFGRLPELADAPAPAAADASDKLFGRRPAVADTAEIARVFGATPAPAAERPANRILPDLTAKPVAPPRAEEPRKPRKPSEPRAAKPKRAATRTSKAKPVETPVAAVVQTPVPMPVIRVRRRPKDETGLARGERWKRRLPRFAR